MTLIDPSEVRQKKKICWPKYHKKLYFQFIQFSANRQNTEKKKETRTPLIFSAYKKWAT